ncbi:MULTISPECIES: MSHA biogenesis protein MshP [Shewanella]|uniref:MSHA biogenesis protein MshP n=1 Tax=Shewanella carassii TaxID=1987584 RepID=A0ABQ1TD09_9GAMM|nr:MSHA biogenesis protein MshP [Shewanella carassii]BCV68056.1 MSHA biogenesis protein MshP [Shewanella carassii]GGE91577.1 MSHA biogenesis protein MshP [Shewanella carassii]
MFPSRNYHYHMQRHQRGSALVIAIFVILVMSLLAATLLRVGGDADEGVNLEVWGLRAFNAANSGADAALARLFPLSGGTAGCAAVGSSWAVPDVSGFHGCNVQLSCETLSQDASPDSAKLYRIRSLAVCESGSCGAAAVADSQCLRVSRVVEVEARE